MTKLTEDFEVERRTVRVTKALSIEVRALTLEDLTLIVSRRRAEIETLLELWQKSQTGVLARDPLTAYVGMLLVRAPDLVAEVISVCNDDFENVVRYKKMKFDATKNAVLAIAELTFEEVGGLKNLLGALRETVRAVSPDAETPSAPPKEQS